MDGQLSVLIVNRSEETREVLQTVLQRRGVRTLAAGRTAAALDLLRRHQPDLIVLDLELDDVAQCTEELAGHTFLSASGPCGAGVAPASGQGVGTPAPQYQPRLVLLGNLRGSPDRLPEGEFVSKPYHYGPLIRKIEELLANRGKGDSPHLPEQPSGCCAQMGTVPFSPREDSPCPRSSSSAAPIRAAASS